MTNCYVFSSLWQAHMKTLIFILILVMQGMTLKKPNYLYVQYWFHYFWLFDRFKITDVHPSLQHVGHSWPKQSAQKNPAHQEYCRGWWTGSGTCQKKNKKCWLPECSSFISLDWNRLWTIGQLSALLKYLVWVHCGRQVCTLTYLFVY